LILWFRVLFDYGLAIFDSDSPTRIVIHANCLVLTIEPVRYIVANLLLSAVLLRLADTLVDLIDIPLLHAFLYLLAGIAACDGAADCRDLLAVTAADLAPDQAADYCTGHGSGNLIGILGWVLYGHELVAAFLARHGHRFGYGRYGQHVGVVPRIQHSVSGCGTKCGDRYGADNAADYKLFAFHCLHLEPLLISLLTPPVLPMADS
jgi:hypothetical protein